MVLLYAIYALNLNQIPLIHPVVFTLCLVAGLLTFVYERVGVVVFTSIFGAGLASFCGLFLYIMGVGSGGASYSNLLVPIEYFLITNIYLVGGATLVLLAAGLFVQLKWTAHRALLSSDRDGTSIYEHRRNNVADSL